MIARSLAIVAAVCVSTGAASKPLKHRVVVAAPARSTAHDVVLENIVGRVQLDTLIAQIVASGGPKLAERRGNTYANLSSTKLRDRS